MCDVHEMVINDTSKVICWKPIRLHQNLHINMTTYQSHSNDNTDRGQCSKVITSCRACPDDTMGEYAQKRPKMDVNRQFQGGLQIIITLKLQIQSTQSLKGKLRPTTTLWMV